MIASSAIGGMAKIDGTTSETPVAQLAEQRIPNPQVGCSSHPWRVGSAAFKNSKLKGNASIWQ